MADHGKLEYLDREALDALVALCDREARLAIGVGVAGAGGSGTGHEQMDAYRALNALARNIYEELLASVGPSTHWKDQLSCIITYEHVQSFMARYGVTMDRFTAEE